jgi:hypothetical protein
MSKSKFIAIVLFILILVGTVSFVMGADVSKNPHKADVTPQASSSATANKAFTGKLTYLSPWTDSDNNLLTIKTSSGSYRLSLVSGKGDLEMACWITLNSAMTANAQITVYTDSKGHVYMVEWSRT